LDVAEDAQFAFLAGEDGVVGLDGFWQFEAEFVEAAHEEVEDAVGGFEVDASGVDEQGEVVFDLQLLYLSAALEGVFVSLALEVDPDYFYVRLFLLLACVSAQFVQQFLLLFELRFAFLFLFRHLLYFGAFPRADALDLYAASLVLHVDLHNF
jgi:hypothetical protein